MINKVFLTRFLQMSLTWLTKLKHNGTSDHISLNITLAFYTESSINHPSFNYFNGDFVSLRSMINYINLTNRVQACDNINDKWDCSHKTIADGVNLFVR